MHIITGLILASLFGKKNESKAPFVRYTGPITTQHQIEGRIRFKIQKLKNNDLLIQELLSELQKIDGIHSSSANSITGSLVIVFDSAGLEPEFLFSVLVHLLHLEEELEVPPISMVQREIQTMGEAANLAIYDRSLGVIDLKTALPLMLGLVGIRKMLQEGWATLPSGLILVWWAYQSISKQ